VPRDERDVEVSVLIDEPLVLLWSAVEPVAPLLLLFAAFEFGDVCGPPVDELLLLVPEFPVLDVPVLVLDVPLPVLLVPEVPVPDVPVPVALVPEVPVLPDDDVPPVPVCATAMPTAATRTADAAARLKPLGNWLILKLLIPVDARPEADPWDRLPASARVNGANTGSGPGSGNARALTFRRAAMRARARRRCR
jgi:hypothetical protein